MDGKHFAVAGSLESNDILIRIAEAEPGTEPDVTLASIVMRQFGASILGTIRECLARAGLRGVSVDANDRGALDCTIHARMETAIARYREAK